MRITRTTNIFVKTERKLVVGQPPTEPIIGCGQCAEPMIRAQTFADFFGISSRTIYRLIESEKIQFIETEANEIYVCPICVKRILESIQ